jgi:hypothetical protein
MVDQAFEQAAASAPAEPDICRHCDKPRNGGCWYCGPDLQWSADTVARMRETAQERINRRLSSHVNCAHGIPLDLSCGACKAGEIVNPKDAVGSQKLSFSKMPKRALAEVALAFMDGAKKYGALNWRSTPVRLTVYTDAISRHVAALEDGQDCATDGARLHHLAYIAAGAMVALDAYLNGRLDDDRPIGADDPDYMAKLNERAAKLLAG